MACENFHRSYFCGIPDEPFKRIDHVKNTYVCFKVNKISHRYICTTVLSNLIFNYTHDIQHVHIQESHRTMYMYVCNTRDFGTFDGAK